MSALIIEKSQKLQEGRSDTTRKSRVYFPINTQNYVGSGMIASGWISFH